jgi:Taurine catabolism dioxygenase TauD, TfdA family
MTVDRSGAFVGSRRPIVSPAAWRASDVADRAGWTATLTESDVAEIIRAVAHATAQGKSPDTLTRDDVPLGSLGERIAEWAATLRSGRGFVLVRGFPVGALTPAETELAYVGLGVHMGTPVSQDARGTLLGHVRDLGIPRTSPAVRLYTTTARQDFHTDGADIVGLLCLQRAKSGGESRIASAAAVYNEILRTQPDLLDVLYEPMYWDRNDEQAPGEPPFYALAPVRDVNGTPRIFYIGWYIRDAQRHAEVPRLTDAQRSAMDAIERIANDPAFYVEMDFQPGDIQLLNNAVILHAREAYVDDAAPERKRHLLRLWLSAHDFSAVEDDLRRGIPRRAPVDTRDGHGRT